MAAFAQPDSMELSIERDTRGQACARMRSICGLSPFRHLYNICTRIHLQLLGERLSCTGIAAIRDPRKHADVSLITRCRNILGGSKAGQLGHFEVGKVKHAN